MCSFEEIFYFMEILSTTIKKNGFVYDQVDRNEYAAIYAQKIGEMVVGYEVFEVRQQKEGSMVLGGVTVELKAKELFPGDNEFGKTAWSCKKLSQAKEIFAGLVPGWNKE